MLIRKITLHNLHSIREKVEIDFTQSPLADTGLFAITGDTGAGKTTILDALTLALYGDVCRQSDARDTLSHGAEEGFAECEFEANGGRFLAQWRVRQTKSKKAGQEKKSERSIAEWDATDGTFRIVAERKVKEVNHLVEEITGLDFARFTRSVMLAQGDFAAFLKASDKDRSDLLERITGTEIYSELSKAALERKNLEKANLDKLTNQRDALRILTKEELKEKQALLKQQNKEQKAWKDSLAQLNAAINWLLSVQALEKKSINASQTLEAIINEKTAHQTDLDRLAAYKKSMPLHPALDRLDEKEQLVRTLQFDLGKSASAIQELEAKAQFQQLDFSEKKAAHDNLRKEQPAAMQLFGEVTALDAQIQEKVPSLDRLKEEWIELADQTASITNTITALQSDISQNQKEDRETNEWLAKNAHLSALSTDLSLMVSWRDELRKIYGNRSERKKEIAQANDTLTAAQATLNEARSKQETAEKELAKSLAQFNDLAPKEYATDRNDLLEKLKKDLDAAANKRRTLEGLHQLSAHHDELLRKITEAEQQLNDLAREQLALDTALLDNETESEEADKTLKFKLEIYRQQLAIANYEKDRADLKEGEPCPLCFSTEHPFRHHEFAPFVDKAKEELDQAEALCQQIQTHRRALIGRLNDINSALHLIDSTGPNALGQLRMELWKTEQKMVDFRPQLDNEEDFARSTGSRLAALLSDFDENLKIKQSIREELARLHQVISRQENALRTLENEVKQAEFSTQEARNRINHLTETARELDRKIEEMTTDLNGRLAKFGYSFSPENGKALFDELEDLENAYSQKKASARNLENQLTLDRQKLEQSQKELAAISQKQNKLKLDLERDQAAFDEISAKRTALFGTKDPAKEREDLLKKLDLAEEAAVSSKSMLDQTNAELSSTKQTAVSLKDRIGSESKAIGDLLESLHKSLTGLDFLDLTELRSSILHPDESERLGQLESQLNQRETETRLELKNLENELANARKQPLTDQPLEALHAESTRQEEEIQAINQQIGALKQQLSENDNLESESKRLLEEIERQRAVFNRWDDLYDLIGSSDGKKFRVFAQGLTLQKLVQLANVHLESLHGRYIIAKRPSDDLELDIVDTYQADNRRSMHTLSGGESFLVSLALALGLSDMAGKNALIKSLFIDEGFGTLDDQALDMALATLENLQAKGKTIGIISHVKELKERIPVQIKVVKHGGGISRVELPTG